MILTCPRTGKTVDISEIADLMSYGVVNSLNNPLCCSDTVLIMSDYTAEFYAELVNRGIDLPAYRALAHWLRDIAPAYAREMPRADTLS